MAYGDALARVGELRALVDPLPPPAAAAPAAPAGTAFTEVLRRAQLDAPSPGGAGAAVLASARNEVGVAEQPPGSNDGARIADYRTAVAGAAPGQPWCATFVSWAAAQTGAPLGDAGEGLNSVAAITDWARRTGRLQASPQPGDLVLYGDRHVGIVESVNADGSLETIEGNEGDAVRRVHRRPDEPTGFVRL